MRKPFGLGVVLALSLLPVLPAAAQSSNPSTNPQAVHDLGLSAAQKQTIYTSARNSNFKNETPPNFQPLVGVVVPETVALQPMPKTVAELAPQTRDFQLAVVSNQVVIVDPKGRRVVEVISGEGH